MKHASVTFLGDALCNPPMLEGHATADGYDFRPVFAPLRDLFSRSDLVVANLETPLSPDGADLTHEKWCFNSPRAYAEALQWAGVGFVTTANNHCLDRGTAGVAATVRVLDELGLPHTGTFADPAAAARPAIADAGGFRLGILSYTYGTNAFSNREYLKPEESFMVNLLQEQELSEPLARAWFEDPKSPDGLAYEAMERGRWPENLTLPVYERIEPNEARLERLADDIARLRAAGPDLVALGMHAGGQNNPAATPRTKALAAFALAHGADLVVGNHEHVVHGGDFSRLREGKLAAYCLGDLVSSAFLWADIPGFDEPPPRVAFDIAWHVDLDRDPDGAARVAGSSFAVLVRRKGARCGQIVVHPAAELWRSLPAGAEKDALAADIRGTAATFAGRPFDSVEDEYELQGEPPPRETTGPSEP